MRKIIDGKTYNTETATLIGSAESSSFQSDMDYWEEALYKTRKGAYFIAGEGGAMSSYASDTGGGWSGYGEGLRPVIASEAMEWLENAELYDELEEHFSDLLEPA